MINWMKFLELDVLSKIGDVIEQEGLTDGAVPSGIFEEINTAIESIEHKNVKEIDVCIKISTYGLVSSPPFYKLTRDEYTPYLGGLSLEEERYAIHVRTQNQLNKYLKGIEEFYKNKYNTQILPDNVIRISCQKMNLLQD